MGYTSYSMKVFTFNVRPCAHSKLFVDILCKIATKVQYNACEWGFEKPHTRAAEKNAVLWAC